MGNEIRKVVKNYYRIKAEPICSVFLDEELMKKANNILYRFELEINALLENNPTHIINEEWSLAYPKGIQKTFYGTNLKPATVREYKKFFTEKIDNLYFTGDENIYSDELKQKITTLMEQEELN